MIADHRTTWHSRNLYDVVGVGFGPANLALAISIQEETDREDGRDLRSLFLERRERFAWHPNMLIEGARIQLSFLKDLVTLRNPQSHFSFLNYLLHKNRLAEFVNLRQFYPTRSEFNDYYTWVASQLESFAQYGREVQDIQPVRGQNGEVDLLEIESRDRASGQVEKVLARNLVVATGGIPWVPEGIPLGEVEGLFHSHDFLARVQDLFPDREAAYRFVVVGSGQSAAEIFQHLIERYCNATVVGTLRRFAYKPADSSEFVNEIFNPESTDFFYSLSNEDRKAILASHYDTNYSAVDLDLIRAIYEKLYDMKVVGDSRAQIRHLMELRGVRQENGKLTAEFFNKKTSGRELIEADGVILATGYQRATKHPLLEGLDTYLEGDGSGGYEIDRDYRVVTRAGFLPRIFLQGFCESSHGLSDTLLSVLPIRAREILDSILEGETAEREARELAL